MAALALKRDPDVLQNRKMRKHSRNLERAHKPHPRNRGRTRPSDLAAIEENAPARRREEMGKQIEARRLTGTIWTDQRVDRPTPDRQIDVLDGHKALELFGQTLRRQYCVFRHLFHSSAPEAAPGRALQSTSGGGRQPQAWGPC